MSIFMLRRRVPQTDALLATGHGYPRISIYILDQRHGYARFLPIQGLTVTCVEIRSLNHQLPTCLVNAPPRYIRINEK